jgi:hypothetical protein
MERLAFGVCSSHPGSHTETQFAIGQNISLSAQEIALSINPVSKCTTTSFYGLECAFCFREAMR